MSVALAPEAFTFFERHVAAFDAGVRDSVDALLVTGDDVTIGIARAADDPRRGVQDILCRLRRPAGRETITIGRTTIEVDGTRAVWKFR